MLKIRRGHPRAARWPGRLFVAAWAASILCGCASSTDRAAGAIARARAVADGAGLVWEVAGEGALPVASARRGLGASVELVVYLEGDGRAWETRRRPADDPTPLAAVGLALAVRDTSPAVLYVARPCQFVGVPEDGPCETRHWTGDRYGEEILAATTAAIERALAIARAEGIPVRRVLLVGYSGGGAVAALLAARRADVSCLITVAANLDLDRWTGHHGVSPLSGSLDPASESLGSLAQVHLSGALDERVPTAVLDAYLARSGPGGNRVRRVVDGFDHRCCWERDWPAIVGAPGTGTPPACELPRSR